MQKSRVFNILFGFSIISLIFTDTPIAGQTRREIPARFRGEWVEKLSSCGSPDETRLRLSARQVNFYESTGTILSLRTAGDTDLYLVVELSGEGERWRDSLHFRLSKDGRRLMSIEPDKTVFTRYRCTSNRSVTPNYR